MATPTPSPAFAPDERPLEEGDESELGRAECVSTGAGGADTFVEDVVLVEVEVNIVVLDTEWLVIEVEVREAVVEVAEVVEVIVGGPVCTGRESLGCHRIETPSAW